MESSSNNCSFTSGGESRYDQSTEFFELSAFIAEISQNPTNKMTIEQKQTLHSLTNKLLDYLTKSQQTIDSNSSSVFKLLSYAFSLLSNDSNVETESEKVRRLENEIIELKNEIGQIEPKFIQELSEKLHLIGVHSKSDLIDQTELITTSKQQLIDDLVTALDLPPTTNPLNIVNLIQNKLEASKHSEFQFTDPPHNMNQEETEEKIQKLKGKIKNLKKRNNEKTQEIQAKEEHIAEMETAITAMNDQILQNEQTINNYKILSSQLESAKAEASSLSIQLDSAKKRLEKKKKQNTDLKSQVSQLLDEKKKLEIDLHIYQDENKKLKDTTHDSIKSNKPTNEVLELGAQLKKVESEKQHLLAIIDEFRDLLDQQAEELEQKTTLGNELITAIHKLNLVNHELEERCKQAESRPYKPITKPDTITKPSKKLQLSTQNNEIQEVIRSISDICSIIDDNQVKDSITCIIENEDISDTERIINITNILSSRIAEQKDNFETKISTMNSLNSKLKQGLANISKFVERLTTSGEIIKWIPSSYSEQDLRSILLSQVTNINNFINENAPGIIEESTFLDQLSIDNNYSDFEQSMNKIFEKYSSFETEEGGDLMILLTQAIVANDVLRRFDNEAKLQCEHKISEFASYKNEVEIERQNTESKHKAELNRIKDELLQSQIDNGNNKEKLENLISMLQAGSNDPKIAQILSSLKESKLDKPVIERQIIQQANNSESEEIIQQLQQKIRQYEEEKEQVKVKQDREVVEQLNQIEIIKKELTDSLEQMNLLHDENESLHQQVDELREENTRITSITKDQEVKTSCQIEKLKEKYEREILSAQKENRSLLKKLKEIFLTFEDTKQQMKMTMKKKIAKINAEKTQEIQNHQNLLIQKEEAMNDLKTKLEEADAKAKSFEDRIENLQTLLKESQEYSSKLKLEQKMLSTKMQSIEDKLKRERTTYDSQLKLKTFAIETDAKAKIEAIKSEGNRQIQTLLQTIYDALEGSFIHSIKDESIEPQIDEECILYMIDDLKERASQSSSLQRENQHYKEEMDKIKNALGKPSKTSSLSTSISTFLKQLEEKKEEISQLRAENQEMKKNSQHVRSVMKQEKLSREWEEWGRKLLYLVNDGRFSVKSGREIRYAIEECIYVAINKRVIWRRLDLLRDEKKLLLKEQHQVNTQSKLISMNQLLYIVQFSNLIQRLSGHLKTEISYAQSLEQMKQTIPLSKTQDLQQNQKETVKQPLFSNFVLKQNENTPSN